VIRGWVAVWLAWLAPIAPAPAPWLCYPPPVPGPIAQPFVAPACTYCAGHVVVGYLPPPGTPVHALADGTVVWSGRVAGVRYLEVAQVDGLQASYGRLAGNLPAVGSGVHAGDVLGAADGLFTLGLRQAGRPIDPTRLLGSWRGALRLVADGGWPRRAAPPARLACAAPPQVR
jgi:murein DD-endopeptidase MepM/ murein hydrolase activator NlpD